MVSDTLGPERLTILSHARHLRAFKQQSHRHPERLRGQIALDLQGRIVVGN
ncbi:hypothetical protein ACFOGG_02115 [Brenneria rubrifaciens]|uniref:hypothetical protein n=1 Tax=Brenneria rubrifaciens TaxID=55213 RepID=UPI003613865E